MDSRWQLHIISHTHWDREWYQSFQQFRIKLVEVIDAVLDLLDSDSGFCYFMLDGQTVVLEDYLEIKPQQRERLASHIRSGGLDIGPWYVLPDFFLTSAESTVRNLMLGHRLSQEFGAAMKVGYLPDVFGHISQMPQILRGFGIDSAVIYRGVGPEAARTEFSWEASDGSRVLAIYLPDGYCHAANFPSAPAMAREKVRALVERLAPLATTKNLLLLNGCDHLMPQKELPQIISTVNQRITDATLVHTTLARHIASVKAENPSLGSLKGEFRENRPARITPGVLSTRIYLKQTNHQTTTALEKYTEPFCAIAHYLGERYPAELIRQAWRYLLQCHPHDSICGCSIDDVHRDMMRRFTWSQEVAHALTEKALGSLVRHVDTRSIDKGISLLVFNSSSIERTDLAQASVTLITVEGRVPYLADASTGTRIPFQALRREKTYVTFDPSTGRVAGPIGEFLSQGGFKEELLARLKEEGKAQRLEAERWEILFIANLVPALGYQTYVFKFEPDIIQGTEKHSETGRWEGPDNLKAGTDFIENEFFRVQVTNNGALLIEDKGTSKQYEGLHYFEDRGDAGDEYNFSPPPKDLLLTTLNGKPRVSIEEQCPVRVTLKIEYDWRIPKRLIEDRHARSPEQVECPITSYVSLSPSIRRIDFRTEVENRAEDHRLRVGFHSGIHVSSSHAEMPFDVVQRKVEVSEENALPLKQVLLAGGEEVKVGTYPQGNFVSISEGRRGLTVINRGLPEYEIYPDENGATIFITLLRSVGWLSRGDLLARSGNAGPSLPTPEAQCLGKHTFHYSLVPHRGDWEEAKSYLEAYRFNVPLIVQASDSQQGSLPLSQSFVSVQPPELVFSALKKAEESDHLVLRFFNIAGKECQGSISFFHPIEEASLINLNEEPVDGTPLNIRSGNEVYLTVPSKRVVTIRCKLKCL